MPFSLMPQRVPKHIADPVGRAVASVGITPNMVSVFGFGGNVVCAWLITQDRLVLAGVVYLVFSALDLVDGAVARATGQASPFGAVLDAVLDRASEAIVLAACAWYFADRDEWWQVVATYAAIFGSIAVSYVRARAEVLGVSMREGLLRRQERVALLGLGLLFNGLTVTVALMAVLANLTALQRFRMLAIALRGRDAAGPV